MNAARVVDLAVSEPEEKVHPRFSVHVKHRDDDPHYIRDYVDCGGCGVWVLPLKPREKALEWRARGLDICAYQKKLMGESDFGEFIGGNSQCPCPRWDGTTFRVPLFGCSVGKMLVSLIGCAYFVADIVFQYIGRSMTCALVWDLYDSVQPRHAIELEFALCCRVNEARGEGKLCVALDYKRKSLRNAMLMNLLAPFVAGHLREEILYGAAAKKWARLYNKAYRTATTTTLARCTEGTMESRHTFMSRLSSHSAMHRGYHQAWEFIRESYDNPIESAHKIFWCRAMYVFRSMVGKSKVDRTRIVANLADFAVAPVQTHSRRPSPGPYRFNPVDHGEVWNRAQWLQYEYASLPEYMRGFGWVPGAFVQGCMNHIGDLCPDRPSRESMREWADRGRFVGTAFEIVPETPPTEPWGDVEPSYSPMCPHLTQLECKDEEMDDDEARSEQGQWELEPDDYGMLAQSQTLHGATPERQMVDLTGEETETDDEESRAHQGHFLVRMDEYQLLAPKNTKGPPREENTREPPPPAE